MIPLAKGVARARARAPFHGAVGFVRDLPQKAADFPSGLLARSATIEIEGLGNRLIPLANLEVFSDCRRCRRVASGRRAGGEATWQKILRSVAHPPEEESSNRTFVIAAAAVGGLLVLSMICLGLYALVVAPTPAAGRREPQATQIVIDNATMAAGQTATAAGAGPDQAPTRHRRRARRPSTRSRRRRWWWSPPTRRSAPSATIDPGIATAIAQATLAAAQGGGGGTPTPTALPATGFRRRSRLARPARDGRRAGGGRHRLPPAADAHHGRRVRARLVGRSGSYPGRVDRGSALPACLGGSPWPRCPTVHRLASRCCTDLTAGRCAALAGLSNSGKTTLMQALSGQTAERSHRAVRAQGGARCYVDCNRAVAISAQAFYEIVLRSLLEALADQAGAGRDGYAARLPSSGSDRGRHGLQRLAVVQPGLTELRRVWRRTCVC